VNDNPTRGQALWHGASGVIEIPQRRPRIRDRVLWRLVSTLSSAVMDAARDRRDAEHARATAAAHARAAEDIAARYTVIDPANLGLVQEAAFHAGISHAQAATVLTVAVSHADRADVSALTR